MPAGLVDSAVNVEALQAPLHEGRPATILAVGSASTAATGQSYPQVMIEALQAALPKAALHLSVAGGKGLSTVQLLPILRQQLAAVHPQLVLWQTGTVDAIEGVRPAEMNQAIEAGVEAVTAAGAQLILIDQQFSRFLHANVDLGPYQDILTATAAVRPEVTLFPRFALMRYWVENGRIDLESAPPKDRPHQALLMNACIGHALAQFILSGMHS